MLRPCAFLRAVLSATYRTAGLLSLTESVASSSSSSSSSVTASLLNTGAASVAGGGTSANARQIGAAGFDHIALDVTGFIGGAMRLLKIESAAGRERDISRVVGQHVLSTIRRFAPRKSVALFLDGPLPMWRVARYRSQPATSKRGETRLLRAPAGPLVDAVENSVLEGVLDDGRAFMPSQVLFSSSCEFGSAEQKMGAWGFFHAASELTARARHRSRVSLTTRSRVVEVASDVDSVPDADDAFNGESIGFVGASELYFLLCASPHSNAASLVSTNAEYKGIQSNALRQWLAVDADYTPLLSDHSESAPTRSLQSAHPAAGFQLCAEITMLLLLVNGHSSSDLPGVQGGLVVADLLHAHRQHVLAIEASSNSKLERLLLTDIDEGGDDRLGGNEPAPPLFRTMNLHTLLVLLTAEGSRWSSGSIQPAFDAGVHAYLVILLETVCMLCYGLVHNPLFMKSEMMPGPKPSTLITPSSKGVSAAAGFAPTAKSLVAHLQYLVDVARIRVLPVCQEAAEPLTAAEYATLISGSHAAVRDTIERFTRLTVSPNVAAEICDDPHATRALHTVRQILRFSNPENIHRALSQSPTYFLTATAASGRKEAGAWKAWPVDVAQSAALELRDALAASGASSLASS